VAKFHGDLSRDGGGKLAKEKTSRASYKSSRTTVTGGLITIRVFVYGTKTHRKHQTLQPIEHMHDELLNLSFKTFIAVHKVGREFQVRGPAAVNHLSVWSLETQLLVPVDHEATPSTDLTEFTCVYIAKNSLGQRTGPRATPYSHS